MSPQAERLIIAYFQGGNAREIKDPINLERMIEVITDKANKEETAKVFEPQTSTKKPSYE